MVSHETTIITVLHCEFNLGQDPKDCVDQAVTLIYTTNELLKDMESTSISGLSP